MELKPASSRSRSKMGERRPGSFGCRLLEKAKCLLELVIVKHAPCEVVPLAFEPKVGSV